MASDDGTERVVHSHLVVEVVEARSEVVAVLGRIIHFANENLVGIGELHLVGGPQPEGGRHHLRHVATEAVDTLCSPEQQDVGHLAPRVGDGHEMSHTTCIVVDAVVQFDGLVPVVHAWGIVEAVVTGGLGGFLDIGFVLAVIEIEIGRETLSRTVIEVVLRVESVLGIVAFAQILYAVGLADAVVLTCHMVGYEVDNDLHARLVGTLDEGFKLLHTLVNIHSQIRIDIVIIGDGVRRSCPTLHHGGVLTGDAVGRIVGHRGVADNASVPDMAHAHLPDLFQGAGREVVQFSATILLNRSTFLAGSVPIAIESGENLIDYYLFFHSVLMP